MNISSINSSNSYSLYKMMAKLSSGKRINSAADDAAGLAVSQKMKAQSTAYNVANRNITDSQSLLNTAGGGLSSVSSSLQRMRELAMQSSNGTYSDSDKQAMQTEIDQLKGQINSIGQGTQFNGISILNGSSMQLSGAAGASSFNATTDALGLSDFDITGDFDIDVLDQAINTVSGMQGSLGGTYNGMTHEYNSNAVSDINIQSAQSMIEDADMERMIMELKQQQLVQQSGLYAQRNVMKQMKQESASHLSFLNMRV